MCTCAREVGKEPLFLGGRYQKFAIKNNTGRSIHAEFHADCIYGEYVRNISRGRDIGNRKFPCPGFPT